MKKTHDFLELVRNNPDLRIVPLVCADIVGDCDYSTYVGVFGNVRIDTIFVSDEKYYDDMDTLIDDIYNDNCDMWETEGCTAYEMEIRATDLAKNEKWEKVIIVNIDSL